MAILNHGSTLRTADGGQTTTTIVTAANIGTYGVATNATYYVGTTQNIFNRASGAQTLTGVSIDGNAATVTNGLTTGNYNSYALPLAGGTLTGNLTITKASAYLYLNGTNSDSELRFLANSSDRWAMGMNVGDATENLNIYNYTTATTNFTILKASGNVGVGTASPSYKLDVSGAINASTYVYAGVFYDNDNTVYYTNPSGTSNLVGLTVANTIAGSVSGNAATATTSALLTSSDVRTISPSSANASRLTYGFTSYSNNNTGSWADYLHLRSYADSSGGNDNLIMFNKSVIGMRIWQQAFGSATAYATYKDVAFTDQAFYIGTTSVAINRSSASQTLTGVSIDGSSASCTGNAATATILQTARNINGTSFNGSAAITTASWGTARTLTIGSTGKSVDGSAAVSWSLAELGAAATNQTMFIGTTSVAINRASASQTLTGVSIDGNAATATNGLTTSNYVSYSAFTGSVTSTYGNFTTPGLIIGDAQYGFYVVSGNVYYKSASGGVHYWRNTANSGNTMSLDNSGNLNVSGYLQTTGNLIYPSTYGVTQRLEVSNAANNAWIDGLTIAPGGIVTAYGDSRAPIFYDSANTAYYCDPNGVSNLYGVAIRGDVAGANTDNQIFFWGTGNGTTSAIGFKSNSGVFTNPTGNGDGYNTYLTMDTDGRGWVFRRGVGGTDFTSAYTAGWILNNGIWQANASMRAPIFYDSNDTAYYGDFASTSVLNRLNYQQLRRNFASTVYTGTTGSRTVKTFSGVLVGGSAIAGNSAYTVIETTIPQGAYQMGGFTIKWFENYSSTNAKTSIEIAGYWNPVSNGGFVGFEYTTSNPNVQPTIRVGANASGNTVFILDHFSSAYTVIIARDLWLGYDTTDGEWGTGWTMVNTTTIAAYSNIVSAVLRVGPTLTGTGASGSWGISVTGSSASCTGNAATVTTNANLTGHITSVGNATSLGSFTSAQLLAALTDETGTGANVFATSPTLVSPILGTPTSGNLANCTFPTLNQNTTGTSSNITAYTINQSVGTANSPTFATLQLTRLNFGATGATPYAAAAGEGTGNGITFGGDEAGAGYRIFTSMENWNSSGNYSKLTLNWHTGIKIGAYTNYGGIRFYNNAAGATNPTPSEIFSIGRGDSNVRVENTIYAQSFYDINNTSYYLDPASTSILDATRHNSIVAGSTSAMSNGGAIAVYSGGSPYISFHDGTTARTAYFQEAGGRFYFGEVTYTESEGSFRAPLFYDSNDTAYYLDPRSASVLSGLKLNGIDNDAAGNTSDAILWINKPNNNDWGIRVTGNLEYLLKLEGATSHTYNIQGLANGSEFWRCGTDLLYHNSNIRAPIFYDSNDTTYYLNPADVSYLYEPRMAYRTLIGAQSYDATLFETPVTTRPGVVVRGSYPHIEMVAAGIDNVTHGATLRFVAYDTGNATTGNFKHWVIGCGGTNATGLYFGYSANQTNPHYGIGRGWSTGNDVSIFWILNDREVYAENGVRATIFYDRNDTAYYVDPSSNSILLDVEARGGINLRRDLSAATGISFYNTSYYNWQVYMAAAAATGCGANGNLTAPSGLTNVTSWALRSRMETASTYGWLWEIGGSGGGVATATSVMELDTGGILTLSGQVRAPIFYDRDNTAYYIDGASGSKLKYLQIDGDWGSSPFGSGHESFTIRSTYASMVQRQTNGALAYWLHHIAGDGAYNLYGGRGATDGSSWDWSYKAYPNQDGSYVEFRTSARAPIFYDSNDTTYYCDASSISRLSSLTVVNTITGSITGNAGGSSASCTGNAASASYANEIIITNLGTATVSINNGRTAIYRNENGLGAALAYSPVLHAGAGDTMWQVQGTYGSSGNGTFYFRQGYQGVFGNWLTMLSSANYNSYSPTLTGTGASGTWSINVTGNASGTAASISGFNNPTTAATANTIVYRDGSGHIIGNYIFGSYFNASAGNSENPTIGQIWTQNTTDNYLRKSTPAHFRSQVTDGSYPSLTGANASGTWSINVTGNAGGSSASCTGNSATTTLATKATRANGNFYIDDNYGNTVVGAYNAARLQGVFAMGDSYKLTADGTGVGTLYGLAWSHPNFGGVAANLADHGLLILQNGVFKGAWGGGSFRTPSDVRGTLFYDWDNTGYYCDPASTSNLNTITAAGNITAAQYYTGGWFRNNASGNGLYNEATGQHFYSDSASYWNVASSSSSQGIRLRTGGHAGTVRGYFYADTNNDVGLLNQDGNWRLRVVGGDYSLADGSSMRAQIFYDSNDTGYYTDPASTSILNVVRANSYVQKSASQSLSGTVGCTIDVAAAGIHVLTLAASTTISSFTYNYRAPNPSVNTIMLVIKYGGTASITWTNVLWANGVTPTITGVSGYADVYMLTSYQGTTGVWIGTVVSQGVVSTSL